MDGKDVMTKPEAQTAIRNAKLANLLACNDRSRFQASALNEAFGDTGLLAGSYYARKDVNDCVKRILYTTCNAGFPSCDVAMKEFFRGALFQGGF